VSIQESGYLSGLAALAAGSSRPNARRLNLPGSVAADTLWEAYILAAVARRLPVGVP